MRLHIEIRIMKSPNQIPTRSEYSGPFLLCSCTKKHIAVSTMKNWLKNEIPNMVSVFLLCLVRQSFSFHFSDDSSIRLHSYFRNRIFAKKNIRIAR